MGRPTGRAWIRQSGAPGFVTRSITLDDRLLPPGLDPIQPRRPLHGADGVVATDTRFVLAMPVRRDRLAARDQSASTRWFAAIADRG